MRNFMKNNRGAGLIFIILILVVVGIVAAVFVSLLSTEGYIALNQSAGLEAFGIAEGGAEEALYQLKTGTPCTSLSNTNIALGSGSFTTTGALYNPDTPTILSAAISSMDAVIPVASIAGYAPHGRIRIESEEITYTGSSSVPAACTPFTQPCFTGAQRGSAGTAPAGHAIGLPVYQNNCLIQSTGKVTGPVVTSQRVLEMIQQGVSVREDSFTKSTAGAPASQSITGVGFKPKAVIFFWTQQTGAGTGFKKDVNTGVGFATGPANQRAVTVTAQDNTIDSDDGRMRSESNVIVFLSGGGPPTGVLAQANLTSLDADGFTMNWTTNDNKAYRIHYMALGGDMTDAFAGSFNLNTAVGNQAVGGVPFKPDFVMFLWSFTEGVDTLTAHSEMGVGFARSSTARGALVQAAPDGDPTNVNKRWQQRTDSAILVLNPTTTPPGQDAIADFVSMDANGFTINKSDAPAAVVPIFYLALKGGRHQVGAFNQATAVGNQAITGVGFKPEHLMLSSFNLVAQAGIAGGAGGVSFGAARHPTARGSIWFQDNNVDRSDANMYTSTTDVLTLATGPNTINAQADFSSFNTDGFTLNWTTAAAPARQILYWVVGPNVDLGKIDWREVIP